jgi:glycosyltransferase involved in cell wall biosynthesis
MNKKIKVLCLDIEGLHGGSSRSLFNSLKNISTEKADIEVWCKRRGEVQESYNEIGIAVKIVPDMPKVSSLPRISRNLFVLALFYFRDWPNSKLFRNKLLRESERFDLIHCNHEGLYWLQRWINKYIGLPVSMHIRTTPWPTIFSFFQVKIISHYTSGLVFITENERDNFIRLGGSKLYGKVIYNIVPEVKKLPLPVGRVLNNNDTFKVCTLANYSYLRGMDQLIDVALVLKELGQEKINFVVAGDLFLSKSLPGKLGYVARKGGNLEDYANEMGVRDMFLFLGHVTNPERVLSGCHALIRPSREHNPWGRDVLEALSFGLPVIATGTYNRFVEDRVTGFLLKDFDPIQVAESIIELSKNKALVKKMGEQAKKRVKKLCHASRRSQDLLDFWTNIVYSNPR